MEQIRAEELKAKAQQIERDLGLRVADCPICDDMVNDGKCVYCGYETTWTPEQISNAYNNMWKVGNVKSGYERPPKTAKDFIPQ